MYADSMTNINRIEAPSYQDMPANSQTRQLVTRQLVTRQPVTRQSVRMSLKSPFALPFKIG